MTTTSDYGKQSAFALEKILRDETDRDALVSSKKPAEKAAIIAKLLSDVGTNHAEQEDMLKGLVRVIATDESDDDMDRRDAALTILLSGAVMHLARQHIREICSEYMNQVENQAKNIEMKIEYNAVWAGSIYALLEAGKTLAPLFVRHDRSVVARLNTAWRNVAWKFPKDSEEQAHILQELNTMMGGTVDVPSEQMTGEEVGLQRKILRLKATRESEKLIDEQVMKALENDPQRKLSDKDIADKIGRKPWEVTKSIGRLTAKGVIERKKPGRKPSGQE
ncbi:hypothetical protein HY732_05205 [Candidatus Uhrbacteria bacterium]|nr:hypothetical protein [Candidatus Uhrbacteria bacterium]